jgi:hypothetical protein
MADLCEASERQCRVTAPPSPAQGIVSFCVELWNGMEHVLRTHGEDYDHSADLGSGPVRPI